MFIIGAACQHGVMRFCPCALKAERHPRLGCVQDGANGLAVQNVGAVHRAAWSRASTIYPSHWSKHVNR